MSDHGHNPLHEGRMSKTPKCDGRDYGSKRGAGGKGNPPLGTNARAGHGGADEMRIRREQERFMSARGGLKK